MHDAKAGPGDRQGQRDRRHDEQRRFDERHVDELVAVQVARVVTRRVLHDPQAEGRDREHGREHQLVQVPDVVPDHRLLSWPEWNR